MEKGRMMIPVAFITDKNFIMQTGVAMTSLLDNKKPETLYDIFVIAAECTASQVDVLRKAVRGRGRLTVIHADLAKYEGIRQLAHIPAACLLKFDLCDLIQVYDKILYLDGDICVRGDLSELYQTDLGSSYIAGVPSIEMIYGGAERINAGIMLFNARKMRRNHMSCILMEKRKMLGDRGSMDQQTFNLVMAGRMKFLSFQYNFIPDKIIGRDRWKYPLKKLNELYRTDFHSKKEMAEKAVILHYATGTKPWKYSFVSLGNEWYDCYKKSVFGRKKLKRAGRVRLWSEKLRIALQEGGVSGMIHEIRHAADSRLSKAKGAGIKWG